MPIDQRPTTASSLSRLPSASGFLGTSSAYGSTDEPVACRETHMSWIFLSGDEVYKLKKSVRLSYLDFSTLERAGAIA